MDASAYPFIDIAVLDPVRGRFAAGEALLLLDVDLDTVLWANAPGAALIGADDLIAAVGLDSGLGAIARRQIMGAPGYHRQGQPTQIVARIAGRAVNISAEQVALPDGAAGILLAAVETPAGDKAASRAVAGFADSGQYLAIIDHEATVQAATEGFEALGFTREALAALIADIRTERDRLVKRRIRVGERSLPVGFARLTDAPALHLLVTVDDGAEPIAAAQPEAGLAVATEAAVAEEAHEPSSTETNVAPSRRAIRFLWRTDEAGRINAISDEFLEAAGLSAEQLMGKTFLDLAREFGIDKDGAIAGLLERRDTWSGRTVYWPIGESSVPVDLAALPAYSRDRSFEGFRGFGVARFSDAQPLPVEMRQPPAPVEDARFSSASDEDVADTVSTFEAAEPAEDEPLDAEALQVFGEAAPDEPAALADDKVIRLSERRERTLSQAERSAFREIGDRLRSEEAEKSATFGKRNVDVARALDDAPVVESAEQTAGPVAEAQIPPADTPDEPALPFDAPGTDDRVAAEVYQHATSDAVVESENDDPLADEEPPVDEIVNPHTLADLRQLDVFDQDGHFDDEFEAEPPVADTSIVERLPVPVLIHTGDDLHYANPEFLSLTGYDSLAALENAGGLDALLVGPFDSDEENGERQLRLRRMDGVEFPIDALLRSVKWRAGNALMLVIREIGGETDQDDSHSLAEARARIAEMRTILDTATDGVVMIDLDGSIRSISRPAEALFGFDSDELAGKPFTSLFAIESQSVAREYLTGLSEHGVASLLNDGREVIGREAQGRFIPLFMTIGRMPNNSGYCAVLRDVTQWKRAEEELSQSRRQAERASSQKTDFLARVSHEIRTPLNAIIGFSELMLDEKFGPIGNDRYRDYMRDINRSGSHVLDLVNDLLDITKIEAGEQEMSYEAVSLNDTLAEAVSIMQPQANRERVIIRSSFTTRLPQIVADLRSVRQIALNILSNAVRYTQAGGQVIISTAHEPNGDIVMRVRDTGVGMTQAEIEQALKPFKQINALNRTRGDGTGLGLPLTKAMVEANRARFVITSAPNEGTLVEVVFPSTRVLAQ